MERVCLPALSRVAVCGGTHGNEMSGVYLVKEMEKQPVDKYKSFTLTTVISNPRAVEACKRYIETDLNRCFSDALLSTPVSDVTPYEMRRAKELNNLLGPKGSHEAMDLVCDLHNSTANMGLCLISNACDWIILHLYKYMMKMITTAPVRFIYFNLPLSEAYSQDSLGKHSFAIEIGPQPHGVVRADIFHLMKEAVDHTFHWVESFNLGTDFEGGEVEVYTMETRIDYPRNPETNEIMAAIHPKLQDRDFSLLKPGDPIFLSFTGETIKYDGKELYPFFVNESAYYEKNTAFCLGQKITVTIPTLCMNND